MTNAGLSLVGAIPDKAGFHDKCNHLPVSLAHPENQISCADVFATAFGAMCSGSPSFEAAHEFDDDRAFYQDALGIGLLPSPRLRQRLDQAALGESEGLELPGNP